MTWLLLIVSLATALSFQPLQAQEQEGAPVRVPPGAELRATLDGKTAQVKTERNGPQVVAAAVTRLDPDQELGDLVPLQFFRITARVNQPPGAGHSVTARFENMRTGESGEIELKPYGAVNMLVSDMILVGIPETENPDPQVQACPGDDIRVTVGQIVRTLKVLTGDEIFDRHPCHPAAPPATYHLSAVGGTSRTYNPESGDQGDPLEVQLMDEHGRPVADEEIVWRFKETDDAYVTATDETGKARLDFAVVQRGSFIAVAEGMPVGKTFIDKQQSPQSTAPAYYEVEVAPLDPLIAVGIEPEPPTFHVEFIRPTMFEVWMRSRNEVQSLLYDERFFVRVWPSRYITTRTQPLEIQVRGSGGDVFTILAERTASGVFETSVPMYTGASANPSDNRIAVPQNPGHITISAAGGRSVVPVYPTNWDREHAEALAQLAVLEDALTAASDSPDLTAQQRAGLHTKLGLIGTANRWMRENLGTKQKAVVAYTYLGLAALDTEDLGATIDADVLDAAANFQARYGGRNPLPISLRGPRPPRVRFSLEAERDKVIAAFASARRSNFTTAWETISFDVSVDKVLKGLRESVESPGLGVYTAVTGWTADGEVATSFQQVMGGVEGLIGLVSVGATTLKLASIGRSAQALLRRVAAGRARRTSLDFNSPGAKEGLTVTKAVADEALDAAKRRTRTREKYTARVDKANAQLDELKAARAQEITERSSLVQDLERMRAELQGRVSRGETRNKTLLKEIGVQERKIGRLDQRIQNLDGQIAKKLAAKLRAYAALGRMERIGLSKAEVADLIRGGGLPDPWDRIADKFVHRLYEDHVTPELNRLLGGNFKKGLGIKLNSSHPSMLGEKFGELIKDPRRQKRTKRPIPDHVDDLTGDVADSKFYDFDRNTTPEYHGKAAREITETVEKGRMVQREIIRRKRREHGLPELDDEATENLVNRVVFQRQVIIVTPTAVPANVQSLIRQLIGARSAATLRFRVIKPDLLGWAEASRF